MQVESLLCQELEEEEEEEGEAMKLEVVVVDSSCTHAVKSPWEDRSSCKMNRTLTMLSSALLHSNKRGAVELMLPYDSKCTADHNGRMCPGGAANILRSMLTA
jgi:hypothetical protein